MTAVEMLSQMQGLIEDVAENKEKIGGTIKEINQVLREASVVIGKVYACGDNSAIDAVCSEQLPNFEKLKCLFSNLKAIVPSGEYFRYHEMFRFALQKSINLAAFHVFLKDYNMIQPQEVCGIVGLTQPDSENAAGFLPFDIEDYLMGLLMLGAELARLSVTSVTNGNYTLPLEIREYLSDLDSGFRLLNLKNDGLRRKYDSLKYDLRRVEEVVFDLTVRGLIAKDAESKGAGDRTGDAAAQEKDA